MIRFMHAADLHLDRPFEGLKALPEPLKERIKNSIFEALDTIVKTACDERVDFFILAGDLFDGNHRSIRAQKQLIAAMEQLCRSGIPAYVVSGNHDYPGDAWAKLTFPDNVYVFPEQPATFYLRTHAGERVALHGFSYPRRHITEDMAALYPTVGQVDYQIGILHGALRSSSAENNYAPFTLNDLAEKPYDYWALGHIHKQMQISEHPQAWYSGSVQGLSIKETGQKGALFVQLDQHGADVQLRPAAPIIWESCDKNFEQPLRLDQLDEEITAIKSHVRRQEGGLLLKINLSMASGGWSAEAWEAEAERLIDATNEEEADRDDFVWLICGELTVRPSWSRTDILSSPHFIGDLFRAIDSAQDCLEALEPLYSHRLGRRYLAMPEEDALNRIRCKAEQLLADALLSASDQGTDYLARPAEWLNHKEAPHAD
ncbi:MAG: DNA repair exonuclease [Sporolactobacillus sp.]